MHFDSVAALPSLRAEIDKRHPKLVEASTPWAQQVLVKLLRRRLQGVTTQQWAATNKGLLRLFSDAAAFDKVIWGNPKTQAEVLRETKKKA